MKRYVVAAAGIAAVAFTCFAAVKPAAASPLGVRAVAVHQIADHWRLSIGFGGPAYCPPPVYYAPAPVYYGPPPAYYGPPVYPGYGVGISVGGGGRGFYHHPYREFRGGDRDRERRW